MINFRNIVLFIRNHKNKKALQQGVSFAKRNNAALTVVEVFDSQDDTLVSPAGTIYLHEQTYLIDNQNRIHRGDTLREIQKLGIPAEHKYMLGGSDQKILEAVKQNKHDLVIVGVGNSNENIGFEASTAVNLVRRCPVAIWIVKPSSVNTSGGNVLAAVDPAPGPGPFANSENALNKQILASRRSRG